LKTGLSYHVTNAFLQVDHTETGAPSSGVLSDSFVALMEEDVIQQ
jgi:hypothetical protein